MWAGIPPVVLGGNATSELVEHERTGLICDREADYPAAIERLAADGAFRRWLSDAARIYARTHFDPGCNAMRIRTLFEQTAGLEKRRHPPLSGRGLSPAARFVATLGEQSGPFAPSLEGTRLHPPQKVLAADALIAESSAVLARGEGGVIHHRNVFPGDPLLRLWSGLIARRAGDFAAWREESEAAVVLGLPAWRIAGEPIP
jgi:hypothetical protein